MTKRQNNKQKRAKKLFITTKIVDNEQKQLNRLKNDFIRDSWDLSIVRLSDKEQKQPKKLTANKFWKQVMSKSSKTSGLHQKINN